MVFGYGWTQHFSAEQIPDLSGKVAVVTGSNSGVGKETASKLAENGAKVILACRNPTKAETARKEIEKRLETVRTKDAAHKVGSVEVGKLDLGTLTSVKAFAEDFLKSHDRLDILVCNAAIVPDKFTASPTHELTFVTNHLAHFYLCSLLLPLLIKTGSGPGNEARLVIVAADVTEWMDWTRLNGGKDWLLKTAEIDRPQTFNGPRAYLRTKIMNVLFVRHLNKLLERAYPSSHGPSDSYSDLNLHVNALHPGVVGTEIFFPSVHSGDQNATSIPGPGLLESFARQALKLGEGWSHLSAEHGALTSLYLATSPEVRQKGYRGMYFFPFGIPTEPAPICKDEEIAAELWGLSMQLIRDETADPAAGEDFRKLAQKAAGLPEGTSAQSDTACVH